MGNDDGLRDGNASASSKNSKARRKADKSGHEAEPHIRQALRSVYDQTVGEKIPDSMLDLLGRLD